MQKYTLNELEAMPTLSQGQTDDLKVEKENVRVWLSRMTIADGMPYNNEVTVDIYDHNEWATVTKYEAVN